MDVMDKKKMLPVPRIPSTTFQTEAVSSSSSYDPPPSSTSPQNTMIVTEI